MHASSQRDTTVKTPRNPPYQLEEERLTSSSSQTLFLVHSLHYSGPATKLTVKAGLQETESDHFVTTNKQGTEEQKMK